MDANVLFQDSTTPYETSLTPGSVIRLFHGLLALPTLITTETEKQYLKDLIGFIRGRIVEPEPTGIALDLLRRYPPRSEPQRELLEVFGNVIAIKRKLSATSPTSLPATFQSRLERDDYNRLLDLNSRCMTVTQFTIPLKEREQELQRTEELISSLNIDEMKAEIERLQREEEKLTTLKEKILQMKMDLVKECETQVRQIRGEFRVRFQEMCDEILEDKEGSPDMLDAASSTSV
ncbi:hypothetical protein GMRT_11490 [Giardia muris]|uniref:Uncharacterized protein n=1 Tax=Giardia muris TaxID=5742 RepID=A0A4Z1SVJ3_GIAMU|nr:hypothetical protein GMRT_11490 [Giardia muris]|eukprot:TNJ29794.1 hypothetical protein GMRT_11490 [Giardia muris]